MAQILQTELNKLVPVEKKAIEKPAPTPVSNVRAALSPDQQTQTDTLSQFYSGGLPLVRHAPFQASANTQGNAAVNSAVSRAFNRIPVTPATPQITDGLIHGDLIWETDPAYVMFRDDFGTGGVVSGAIGQLGWNIQNIGAGSVSILINGAVGGFPNFGVVAMTPDNTTANHGGVMCMTPTGNLANGAGILNTAWMPLLDYPGWQVEFIFCFAQLYPYNTTDVFTMANTSAYIGLGDLGIGGPVPRPYSFLGVRYDTDTTSPSIGDTTFVLEASFNAQQGTTNRFNNQGTLGGTFVTSITPTAGVWYRVAITCTASGVVNITLSGGGATTGAQAFTVTRPSYRNAGNTSALLNNATTGVMGVGPFPITPDNTNGYLVPAPGSVVTLSDFSGSSAFANGVYKVLGVNGLGIFSVKSPGVNTNTPGTQYNLTSYPGLTPIASLCNDSTGGTAVQARQLMVDFFSLVWNPGVNGGSGSPNSTLSRYF